MTLSLPRAKPSIQCVAYHGTSEAPFNRFDPARIGTKPNTPLDNVSGFYFARTVDHARQYGPNVCRVTLDLPLQRLLPSWPVSQPELQTHVCKLLSVMDDDTYLSLCQDYSYEDAVSKDVLAAHIASFECSPLDSICGILNSEGIRDHRQRADLVASAGFDWTYLDDDTYDGVTTLFTSSVIRDIEWRKYCE